MRWDQPLPITKQLVGETKTVKQTAGSYLIIHTRELYKLKLKSKSHIKRLNNFFHKNENRWILCVCRGLRVTRGEGTVTRTSLKKYASRTR